MLFFFFYSCSRSWNFQWWWWRWWILPRRWARNWGWGCRWRWSCTSWCGRTSRACRWWPWRHIARSHGRPRTMTAGPLAGRSRKERCGGRQTDCSCSDLPRALCARTQTHIIIIIISFTFTNELCKPVSVKITLLFIHLRTYPVALLTAFLYWNVLNCQTSEMPQTPPPPVWENIGTWHFDYSITICIVCIKRFMWLWHTTLSSSVNVRCIRRTSCHFRCHIVILSLSQN